MENIEQGRPIEFIRHRRESQGYAKVKNEKVVGVQNTLLKGCDNMDNGSWFWNLVSWVINNKGEI